MFFYYLQKLWFNLRLRCNNTYLMCWSWCNYIEIDENILISDKKNVYNLDGLHHNTFYHVRAKSRNKAGLSDASNIIYLHTTGLNAYPRLGLSSRASRTVSILVIRTCPTVILILIWLSMCTSRQLW